MMKIVSFLPLVFLICASCTVSEEGLDIESSINTDECKESGSTNCVEENLPSTLSMDVRSANPLRPYSLEGDCVSANAGDGTDPRPNNGSPTNPSANLYPIPSDNPVYCFDISGVCNVGTNDTAFVTLKSAPRFFTDFNPRVIAECKRGRFKTQLAAQYPKEEGVICNRHTLELELIGKNINDEEERNPSQARSFLDVLVTSHCLCNDDDSSPTDSSCTN